MARYEDLLTETRSDLSSAPDASVVEALRRSAIRLLKESGIWRQAIDPIPLVPGQFVYDLVSPEDGSRIDRVLRCDRSDRPSFGLGQALEFEFGIERGRDVDFFALRPASEEIVVFGTPSALHAGVTLSLFVVLVPTRSGRTLPDSLVEEWHDGIVAGAKAEMMAVLNKPWTNLEGAAINGDIFNAELGRARREAETGGHAVLRVRPQKWL